jgi:hypothetical protein
MVSSGMRIGAWNYLQWKHVSPITNDKGEIVAARLLVYAGDPEEYSGFITPEAYNSLKDWMDFRESYGENISGESWVMRDIWQTTNITYGANLGLLFSITLIHLLLCFSCSLSVAYPLLVVPVAAVNRSRYRRIYCCVRFYSFYSCELVRTILKLDKDGTYRKVKINNLIGLSKIVCFVFVV